jgi:hypothetical protein
MRRFWAMMGATTAALAAGMAATAFTSVGFRIWDYNWAFAALLAGAALAWPVLKRRRVASVGMAYTGIVATLSGFVMVYTQQLPLKEWVTWWHSVASFAFMALFLVHWLLNNVRLVDFTKRVLREARTGVPVVGAWAGVAVAFAWTWSPAGRTLFYRENYLYLCSWAVFVGVGAAYATWLAFRHPRLRARIERPQGRAMARALVDTSLFLACWGSLLTGFALLYVKPALDANGFKYVSKWWHTATSVALLAILALHIGFNARLLAAHARRLDRDARPPPEAPEAPVAPREG